MTELEIENNLENKLISKLKTLGYEYINIKDEDDLIKNFKIQIEKLNNIKLTDEEFNQIYTTFNSGDNFERASRLRNDKYYLNRKDGKRIIKYFDNSKWCENIFQVSNQITMVGDRTNRYDVTILINGIPMVQIELKRRGNNLKEAFNQINRYKRESFKNLFKYIQIFIISNGNETKYFATNEYSEKKANYKFAFYWSDENNNRINDLLIKIDEKDSFTDSFLQRCQLGKMISKYMIIGKIERDIKILRPYQFYAIEKTLKIIKDTNKSGYIWHTTGSGKTLTSFKMAQEIKNSIPKIDKIFFIVDRKDLNSQTEEEFSKFDSDEEILKTENTNSLIKNIKNDKKSLIITTIQKFDRALKNEKLIKSKNIENIRNRNVVCIFDECHRGQFGDTNREIRKFFKNLQMIGFTGTPINNKNSVNKQTTKDIFGHLIHSYTISEAIADDNVLGFMVQYFKTFDVKKKLKKLDEDEEVPSIDKKEVWESEARIEKVVKNIFSIHNDQTQNKKYNALFATSSIEMLKKYYLAFKKENQKLEEDKRLKVSAIYSIIDNEDIDENNSKELQKSSRNFLKDVAKDFVEITEQKLNLKADNWFNPFRNKVIKSLKNNKLDIVLVVNMLTTGFDSKLLNTLYVDKNLEYHGLLQAFSRTNRIYDSTKTQGNIITYSRPTKKVVDESIREFSDNRSVSTILKENYKEYVNRFNSDFSKLKNKFPTVDSVVSERDEKKIKTFVILFKSTIQIYAILKTFFEFDHKDLVCSKQEYINYQGKYREIYRNQKESSYKESILNQIDFEIENINVDVIDDRYIIHFLNKILPEKVDPSSYKEALEEFSEDIKRSAYSQKKIDLIIEFVNKQLETLDDSQEYVSNIITEKDLFDHLNNEKYNRLDKLRKDNNLPLEDFKQIIRNYEESYVIKRKYINQLLEYKKEDLKKDRDDMAWWEIEKIEGDKIINSIYEIYQIFDS